ncbi:hypothetical protein H2O64_08845 [Kordia sp. YSTF-M3]|uniref:Uncharacterized protein n=1 Tax=Kordia aestuariivivens TaxID=2759037 RepID=A0ABR7Q8U0_9FLAO|nr:hypothetical protein [Kordia aestuariivivens]MBC8754776.1 hypothetical protein [Kordia aestuariivivens]
MKKANFKSLELNKRAISNLKFEELKGGKKILPTLIVQSCIEACDTYF